MSEPVTRSPEAQPPAVSFGAAIRSLTAEAAAEHGLPATFGVEVGRVRSGSPADAAGVCAGDVITDIGPYTVSGGADQFRQAVAARQPGDTMHITVWRNRHRHPLSVQFPAATAEPTSPAEAPTD